MRGQCLWFAVVVSLAAGGAMRSDDKKDASEEFLKKIQGTWKFTAHERDGKASPKDELSKQTITFEGNKWTVRQDGKAVQAGTHKFDPAKKPGEVDATITEGDDKGNTMLGIFELTGDTLKVCFDPKGKARPADFASKEGRMTATVEREKKDK